MFVTETMVNAMISLNELLKPGCHCEDGDEIFSKLNLTPEETHFCYDNFQEYAECFHKWDLETFYSWVDAQILETKIDAAQ